MNAEQYAFQLNTLDNGAAVSHRYQVDGDKVWDTRRETWVWPDRESFLAGEIVTKWVKGPALMDRIKNLR
jgi:hypothetical protein